MHELKFESTGTRDRSTMLKRVDLARVDNVQCDANEKHQRSVENVEVCLVLQEVPLMTC